MRVSVVIPTYNERGNIIKLIKEVRDELGKRKEDGEIIIVDDNSPDGTSEVVRQFFSRSDWLKLLVRYKERGLASAILTGIKQARGKIIVGMDGDFNHPPFLIGRLIDELKKGDLVVASRFIKGGGMEDKWRYGATYIFNLFLKKVFSFPTMDNMSGFYAIRREALLALPIDDIYQGYGEYHLRLVWWAQKNKLKIREVPVYYQKREYGRSKSNLVMMFWKYLYVAGKLYWQETV